MLVWFGKDVSLEDLLVNWRSAGSNYQPDQPVDPAWQVDTHTIELGAWEDGVLFDAAVAELFRFHIFPGDTLAFAADFSRENRPPSFGDRVVQRVRVVPFLLDAVVLSIVSAVWHETDRRGFTLVTSEHHYGMGEWSAAVSRKRGGRTLFMLQSLFKPDRFLLPVRAIVRAVQRRALRRAPAHFRRLALLTAQKERV